MLKYRINKKEVINNSNIITVENVEDYRTIEEEKTSEIASVDDTFICTFTCKSIDSLNANKDAKNKIYTEHNFSAIDDEGTEYPCNYTYEYEVEGSVVNTEKNTFSLELSKLFLLPTGSIGRVATYPNDVDIEEPIYYMYIYFQNSHLFNRYKSNGDKTKIKLYFNCYTLNTIAFFPLEMEYVTPLSVRYKWDELNDNLKALFEKDDENNINPNGNIYNVEIYRENPLFGKYDNYIIYNNSPVCSINLPLGIKFRTDLQKEQLMTDYLTDRRKKSINRITDMEKDVYHPVQWDNEKNEKKNDIYQIIFNLHFREHRYDDWNAAPDSYWNGVIFDVNENKFRLMNNSNQEELGYNYFSYNKDDWDRSNQSDLLCYLNFTNEDIRYQKSKLKKSFLRLLFFDSMNPADQNLLAYSTVFIDSGMLFSKYVRHFEGEGFSALNYNGDIVLPTSLDLNGIRINREPMVDGETYEEFKDNLEDVRLSSQLVIKDKYNSTTSSEGFYLYLWRDNDSGVIPSDLYMKVEFNHAGYGRTIPFMMPYKDKDDDGEEKGEIKTFQEIVDDWQPTKEESKYVGYGIKRYMKYSYIHLKYQYDTVDKRHVYYVDTDLYKGTDKSIYGIDNTMKFDLYEAKINFDSEVTVNVSLEYIFKVDFDSIIFTADNSIIIKYIVEDYVTIEGKEYPVKEGKVTIDYSVVNNKVIINGKEYIVVDGTLANEYTVVDGKLANEYPVIEDKVTINGKEYTVVYKVTVDGVKYTVVDGKVTIDEVEYTVVNNKISINGEEYTVEDGKVTINGVEYAVENGKVVIKYDVVDGKKYTIVDGKVTINGKDYKVENGKVVIIYDAVDGKEYTIVNGKVTINYPVINDRVAIKYENYSVGINVVSYLQKNGQLDKQLAFVVNENGLNWCKWEQNNNEITITNEEPDYDTSRHGTLILIQEKSNKQIRINVSQEEKVISTVFKANPTKFNNVEDKGGTCEVNVISEYDNGEEIDYTITKDVDWITNISQTPDGFVFDVKANEATERNTKISLTQLLNNSENSTPIEIAIYQEAKREYTFEFEDGNKQYTLTVENKDDDYKVRVISKDSKGTPKRFTASADTNNVVNNIEIIEVTDGKVGEFILKITCEGADSLSELQDKITLIQDDSEEELTLNVIQEPIANYFYFKDNPSDKEINKKITYNGINKEYKIVSKDSMGNYLEFWDDLSDYYNFIDNVDLQDGYKLTIEYPVVDGKVKIEHTVVDDKVIIAYPIVDSKVTINETVYPVIGDKVTFGNKEYTVEDGKVTIDGVEYTVVNGKVTIDYTVVGGKVTIGGKEYTVEDNKISIEYEVVDNKVTIDGKEYTVVYTVTIDGIEYTVVDGMVTVGGTEYTVVEDKVTINGNDYTITNGTIKIEYTVKEDKVTINGKDYKVVDGKVTIGETKYDVVEGDYKLLSFTVMQNNNTTAREASITLTQETDDNDSKLTINILQEGNEVII